MKGKEEGTNDPGRKINHKHKDGSIEGSENTSHVALKRYFPHRSKHKRC